MSNLKPFRHLIIVRVIHSFSLYKVCSACRHNKCQISSHLKYHQFCFSPTQQQHQQKKTGFVANLGLDKTISNIHLVFFRRSKKTYFLLIDFFTSNLCENFNFFSQTLNAWELTTIWEVVKKFFLFFFS